VNTEGEDCVAVRTMVACFFWPSSFDLITEVHVLKSDLLTEHMRE
jgi:hypothetical protein